MIIYSVINLCISLVFASNAKTVNDSHRNCVDIVDEFFNCIANVFSLQWKKTLLITESFSHLHSSSICNCSGSSDERKQSNKKTSQFAAVCAIIRATKQLFFRTRPQRRRFFTNEKTGNTAGEQGKTGKVSIGRRIGESDSPFFPLSCWNCSNRYQTPATRAISPMAIMC